MPKDPTKNVDRYKIRGGQLNEFDFHQNQEEYVKEKALTGKQLIPVKANNAAQSTQDTKAAAKSTKAAAKSTKAAAKSTKGTKARKGTKTTKARKAVIGASAKKLAARKTAKKK